MLKTKSVESVTYIKNMVILFSADWCGPCKPVKRALDMIATQKGVPAFLIDVEECPEQAEHYKISGLPTVLIFKDGTLSKMLTGSITDKELREVL